jgi:hypothetical protein
MFTSEHVVDDSDDGYHECGRCNAWFWHHPSYHECDRDVLRRAHKLQRKAQRSLKLAVTA